MHMKMNVRGILGHVPEQLITMNLSVSCTHMRTIALGLILQVPDDNYLKGQESSQILI